MNHVSFSEECYVADVRAQEVDVWANVCGFPSLATTVFAKPNF